MASYDARWAGGYYVAVGRDLNGYPQGNVHVPGSGWTDWQILPGGQIKSDPQIDVDGPNLDFVATLADDSLGHWTFRAGTWGFEGLGGGFPS
jgi:hypothetical protein